MRIAKAPLTGSWPFPLAVCVILIFFLAVFPLVHLFLRQARWIVEYCILAFYAIVLVFLITVKKASLQDLGFSLLHIKQHLCLGISLAVGVAVSPQISDTLIAVSGLGQSELFSDSVNQAAKPPSVVSLLGPVLIFPVLKQTFFTGFLTQSLLKKFNPVLAVYGTGILFTLAHFKLSLGLFLLGTVSATLFRLTGTLFAPIGFHIGCAFAGVMVAQVYPRLITLFGFLY